jgi:SAM-dependent methyltransferase
MKVARYDAMADFYDETVGDDVSDPSTAALLELAGHVRGPRLLDVASGQGRIARGLARARATVVGVDLSAALLERAREAERAAPLGIDDRQADVTLPAALFGEPSDAAVRNQALADYAEGWWLARSPGFGRRVGAVREPPPGANLAERLPDAPAVPWFLVVRCLRED